MVWVRVGSLLFITTWGFLVGFGDRFTRGFLSNLSFGEGLLLLVREVVELVFVEAGLGAFFLSLSEDLAACVLAAFAGTVARLFKLVWSFLFSTDVAVREQLILSKKTAASLASWDWRYSMHYFSSTIDV